MTDRVEIHVKETPDDSWKEEANRLCAQWCREHPDVQDPQFKIIFDEVSQ